jgi:hypothetical protein
MHLDFHPAVKTDIAAIRDWYVSQNRTLSHALAMDFDAAIGRILRHPQLYVRIGSFHRVRLARFPCHVYYMVRSESVYVLGAADARAEPSATLTRIAGRLS